MHMKNEPDMSWERFYEVMAEMQKQGSTPWQACISILPVLEEGKTNG